MARQLRHLTTLLTLAFALLITPLQGSAEERSKFSIAWSIYVGWMPWDYGANAGIVEKWAKKYGIEIDVVQINDYIESIWSILKNFWA